MIAQRDGSLVITSMLWGTLLTYGGVNGPLSLQRFSNVVKWVIRSIMVKRQYPKSLGGPKERRFDFQLQDGPGPGQDHPKGAKNGKNKRIKFHPKSSGFILKKGGLTPLSRGTQYILDLLTWNPLRKLTQSKVFLLKQYISFRKSTMSKDFVIISLVWNSYLE